MVRHHLEFTAATVPGITQRWLSIYVYLETCDLGFVKSCRDITMLLNAPGWGWGALFDSNLRLSYCGLLGGHKSSIFCLFTVKKGRTAWAMFHGQEGHSRDGYQRLQQWDIGEHWCLCARYALIKGEGEQLWVSS